MNEIVQIRIPDIGRWEHTTLTWHAACTYLRHICDLRIVDAVTGEVKITVLISG